MRQQMVDEQIAARGVHSPLVLKAMRKVSRENYMPSYLRELAYEDRPLPIEEGQTISQPYIVAYMIEALGLEGGERVLEIGTGSGYAAAVLAEIASEVYTIERHSRLAKRASERLRQNRYTNVHVRHGDGTLGWPEKAPFDAIVVTAGGPNVPISLRKQLKIGGRLVVPVGSIISSQKLIRVTRLGSDNYQEEDLGGVRFVPLIGKEGWQKNGEGKSRSADPLPLSRQIAKFAHPFSDIDKAPVAELAERIGDAKIVLLGEASHGTAEFYAMRARITQELIERKGFNIVAVEADWPDAARIDHYVRDRDVQPASWRAFARFPTWMWRNKNVQKFVEWLHAYNATRPHAKRVCFAGLDLYSLYTSIGSVLDYLDNVDPEVAKVARHRYGCLTPWQSDPAAYGRAAITGAYRVCEADVTRMLQDLLTKRLDFASKDGESFFDAAQNARLIADAELYYRIMYYGSHESWNLRDRHMFSTLMNLLAFSGSDAKAVIWEHNSHVGDASATEMASRGELNIGQLCRQQFGDDAYSIGFGTDSGTVAAASYWDGPMEVKQIKPSNERSYEFLCHESGVEAFLLPLRHAESKGLYAQLSEPRLERAIGVIYRPETELASHYFQARLPGQFDEYFWYDHTHAVEPLLVKEMEGMPDTYPFGL